MQYPYGGERKRKGKNAGETALRQAPFVTH
jgi:hypothetical protein